MISFIIGMFSLLGLVAYICITDSARLHNERETIKRKLQYKG